MNGRKRLLAVRLDGELREKLGPALGRAEFETDVVTSYESARELVGSVGFDVVLIHCPEPDSGIEDLVAAIRRPESASREARALLLAAPAHQAFAESQAARGDGQVLSTGSEDLALQEAILSLLRTRPRLSARVMARLTVRLGGEASKFLCQTRDLSRTGMLAILDERYPVGSPVRFQLDLPDDREGVLGEAEVVRHAQRSRDGVDGLGLRFLSFRADDEQRLAAFLSKNGA